MQNIGCSDRFRARVKVDGQVEEEPFHRRHSHHDPEYNVTSLFIGLMACNSSFVSRVALQFVFRFSFDLQLSCEYLYVFLCLETCLSCFLSFFVQLSEGEGFPNMHAHILSSVVCFCRKWHRLRPREGSLRDGIYVGGRSCLRCIS